MKKVLLCALIGLAISLSSFSQVSLRGTTTNPNGAVLNATVDTLNLTVTPTDVQTMTIQVLLTKASGTIAGTVRLYGSNYNNTAGTWVAIGDTATLTDAATNTHTWTVSPATYRYYQVRQSGGTTMAGTLSARAWYVRQ